LERVFGEEGCTVTNFVKMPEFGGKGLIGDEEIVIRKYLYKKLGCFGSVLVNESGVMFEEMFGMGFADRAKGYSESVTQ
jgi:hypothetical protein